VAGSGLTAEGRLLESVEFVQFVAQFRVSAKVVCRIRCLVPVCE
jgi:hypothetical protein